MSNFIDEGRPTTTKPTFVALPSSTSHSTFYECLRSMLCQPQDSPRSPLTRLGVIISYSLHLERKVTSPSTSIISPYVYSELSDEAIRRPQQRKLHLQLLKSRSTRFFNFKSIG